MSNAEVFEKIFHRISEYEKEITKRKNCVNSREYYNQIVRYYGRIEELNWCAAQLMPKVEDDD